MWISLGATALLLIVLGFVMLKGKGAGLIAGYNTMPAEKKAKYDKEALCKCIGKLLLTLGVLTLLFPLGFQLGYELIATVLYCVISSVITIGTVIYVNTSDKFKKKD
jgi:hypothetical protein